MSRETKYTWQVIRNRQHMLTVAAAPQRRIIRRFFRKMHKKKPGPNSSCVCQTRTLSARSGARTLDTLIKSQVLYQLS